jgi:hypothetical protein
MPKWEYMFVEIWRKRVNVINGEEIKKSKDQPDWESWLREQGLKGWELVSEYTFTAYKIHATLKRQILE